MHFHENACILLHFPEKCNKTADFQSDAPFSLKNLKGPVWRLSDNIQK